MSRRILWPWIRALLSIALIVYILWQLDWDHLIAVLGRIHTLYFLAFLVIGIASVLLSAKKWEILLHGAGQNVPFGRLASYYFTGIFFSLFLPSNIGGDVKRIYDLSQDDCDVKTATSSVLMDRGTGTVALLLIVLASLAINAPFLHQSGFLVPILAVCVLITLFAVAIFIPPIRRGLSWLFRAVIPLGLGARMDNLYQAIYEYREKPWVIVHSMLISLLFQGISVLVGYLCAAALHLSVPPVHFVSFIPLITLLSMLPVSINGIGIQDGAFVLLFSRAGVVPAEAFSMSLLFHAYRMMVGLVGGLVYAARR
jgi:uncharacterized protein (TIRG00374 family)